MEYAKAKSACKQVIPSGSLLRETILKTMSVISRVVGGTLGPGGHPVLIERAEHGLPPIVTKDGVTVFRAIGFTDALSHCVMESARDASIRTASDAGDGTTTATILSEAFVRETFNFCAANPSVSPQLVVRKIQKLFEEVILPLIKNFSVKGNLETPEGRRRLEAVASISGNGDVELATAVMQCFDICGDDGNVTLVEGTGNSTYEVEKIEGYPIAMGYEESLQRFFPAFINRADLQQVHIEKPAVLLYFGRINDIQTLVPILSKIQEAWAGEYLRTPNVVLFATGFAESVIANLMNNWVSPGSINILPLLVPNNSPVHNAQRNFLDDVAAVTASVVYDSITNTLDMADLSGLGNIAEGDSVWEPLGVKSVEVSRYRSTIIGIADEDWLLRRAQEVSLQNAQAESQLDSLIIKERLAKLTGGIARLKILGSSNGETKERRDRAEDAVCAVRGAIKHGCTIAGGWMLAKIISTIRGSDDPIIQQIVIPAIIAPVDRLLTNGGVPSDEKIKIIANLLESSRNTRPTTMDEVEVYNVANGKFEKAVEAGLLDSAPAVTEALRNSISIATLLGTLGGAVVFPRDSDFEKSEATAAANWQRDANINPADERP